MRRYRVKVRPEHGMAHVVLMRRWAGMFEFITVAQIKLTGPDAEDKLAEARARATTLAHQVNGLERDRP